MQSADLTTPSLPEGSGLPVVLVHYGNKAYLQYSLAQARRSNPGSRIILLGDATNTGHDGIDHHMIEEFSDGAKAFERQYRHFSTNSHRGELLCFQRWYVLRDFLKGSGITHFLYTDSDVLLFSDVTRERLKYADYDLALIRQFVPCTVFFNRVSVLDDFCEFLTEIYAGRRPYEWDYFVSSYAIRRKNRLPGGASDMTAFHLFHQEHFGRVGELSLISDDAAFDISINAPEPGFEMTDGIKRLTWRDGVPYATHVSSGRLIRMKSLHCQGQSKGRMGVYVQESMRSEDPPGAHRETGQKGGERR